MVSELDEEYLGMAFIQGPIVHGFWAGQTGLGFLCDNFGGVLQTNERIDTIDPGDHENTADVAYLFFSGGSDLKKRIMLCISARSE